MTASTEAAWDSLGKPIAVKQPDAFKVGDRIHITGRCAHFSELMPVHIVDRVTTAFGLPSLFVKREDGAPYAWHANKPIPIVEVMAGHCTRIGD